MHYPDVPWQYNPILRPDRAAFAATAATCCIPWTGPRSRTFRGRLGQGRGARRFHIRMRLDGTVELKLAVPAHMRAELTVRGAAPLLGARCAAGAASASTGAGARPPSS